MRAGRSVLIDTLLPKVAIEIAKAPDGAVQTLDFANLFNCSVDQVWLEIGFGGGENVVECAIRNPRVGIIGSDPFFEGVGKLLSRISVAGIDNIRIYPGDVRDLLPTLPPACLSKFFILFPDPWPKKRHHKRRIFSAKFVHDLAFCLKPSGKLYVSTDCRNYAQIILDLIAQEPFLKTLDRTNQNASQLCRKSETKYETRGISLGHPIINILAQRS